MITSFAQLKTVRGLDSGPLNPFIEDYVVALRDQGYRPGTIRGHLCLFANLNGWFSSNDLALSDLDERALERFSKRRLCRRKSVGGELSALLRLLGILRDAGATPPPRPVVPTPAQALADSYRLFLHEERGCAEWTVSNYARHIDRFLDGLFGARRIVFSRIRAREVTAFVQRTARAHSQPYAKQVVTALRSFLRYLHYRGQLQSDLSAAVPKVAHWRMTALPKHLPAEAVQRVLDACERTSAVGRRNFAILLLLARLGLRAGEIVALQIEDIDWENARLTVRSKKGGGWARLPLPADAGEAIARNLEKGRPPCSCRNVFVRTVAPHVPLSGSPVIAVMAMKAMRKAGVVALQAKQDKSVRRSRTLGWSWAMEEQDGAFVLGWRGEEDGVIAVGMDAAGDEGAGRLFDAQALGGDGDASVRADAGLRACAPDVGPPRAGRGGAQDGALFLAGEIPGGLRSGADFAMLFLGVVVVAQLINPEVGLGQRGDVFGGEKCGEAFLPEVVSALDFALGLRGGRVAQGDFVEAQGGPELGEGIGGVGEEEGVVVHVKCQGQAAGEEGAGEEVEMGEEGFARVEPGQWQEAAVIIDEFEHGRLLALRGQPAMR